eukprot:TRINITY_DN950_c1_g1_i5.p1 TRINITY_DN950_c1_g1~~TRINITY_DN950_c1_g1_i5.p1  ORF type:complete len:537 (+),score=66.92 TRINITY_DN950_c1_g1_i5:24-1613(+)
MLMRGFLYTCFVLLKAIAQNVDDELGYDFMDYEFEPLDMKYLENELSQCTQEAKSQKFSNESPSHFITRKRDKLLYKGKQFYFSGFNSYHLLDLAYHPEKRHKLDLMFESALKLNLTVIRTWAFVDGPTYQMPVYLQEELPMLQVRPGRFDERTFRALDYIVYKASQYDIRLIMTVTNYHQAFGGAPMYVRWKHGKHNISSLSVKEFYADQDIRTMYKLWSCKLATRTNSFSKKSYNEDATIMGWDLINEPLCPMCGESNAESNQFVYDWLKDVAKFMKSVAPKQLLLAGMQGYFDESNEDRLKDNPGAWSVCLGQDFEMLNSIKQLDLTSAHIYPEHSTWDIIENLECGNQCKLDWIRRALQSQLDVSKQLKKPMIVGEFGYPDYDDDKWWMVMRNRVYQEVYNVTTTSMLEGGPAAGALFWRAGVEGDIAWEWRLIYLDNSERMEIPQPQNETENDIATTKQIREDYLSFYNHKISQKCMFSKDYQIKTIMKQQLRELYPEPTFKSTTNVIFQAAAQISQMYPHDYL